MNKHIATTLLALLLLPYSTTQPIGEEKLALAASALEQKADRLVKMREGLRAYKARVDTRVLELKGLQIGIDATASLIAQYRLEAGEVSKEVRVHLDAAKDAIDSDPVDKDLSRSINELDHLSEKLVAVVGQKLDLNLVPTKSKSSRQLGGMITALDKNGTIDNILADTLRVVVSLRAKIKEAPAKEQPERSASTPPDKTPARRRVVPPKRKAVTPTRRKK